MLDRLGQGQVTAELLQPDELVSGMMAQIAADPNLASLLTSFIYSSEGDAFANQPLLHFQMLIVVLIAGLTVFGCNGCN